MKSEIQPHRKQCLAQQTELRKLIKDQARFNDATTLFFKQHAMLHSAAVVEGEENTPSWSYEDTLLDGLNEGIFRRTPPRGEHSIAWCLFHIARIEDMTMNALVAGETQVYDCENWEGTLNTPLRHSANSMSVDQVAELSAMLDLGALRRYRLAVGRRTRQIVRRLESHADLKTKVSPDRIQGLLNRGDIIPEAIGIAEYWSKRDTAGLLLMPATRHNLVHLNEILSLA